MLLDLSFTQQPALCGAFVSGLESVDQYLNRFIEENRKDRYSGTPHERSREWRCAESHALPAKRRHLCHMVVWAAGFHVKRTK